MALHEPVHHAQKTLAEGVVCFACALGALALAAIVMRWALALI